MDFKRVLVMLASMVLAVGVGLSVAAPSEAAAVRCKGSSCSNKDPNVMRCAKDAITIQQTKPGGAIPVQLRWSKKCKAGWARLSSKAGNWWTFRLEVKNGPFYTAVGSPNFRAYTRMSGSSKPMRACIKQYASSSWICTRWF
ncbi:DUF2690 domain-containing protein [Micromonospora sp. NPDC047074]|uniref:DUF2690 domain-containing protein n=1 Tax=Micromonospora sp. NPDC047074 TaxID=3154339 RepID=UPI0033CC401D